MKYNIKVVTTALLVVLIPLSLYIAICLLAGMASLVNEVPPFAESLIDRLFSPLQKTSGMAIGLFFMAYTGAMAYLFVNVNNLRLTLKSIAEKGAFEDYNAGRLYRAGTGIVRFALIKYILMCAFGAFALLDLLAFFTEIIPMLALYTMGKFILVIADMTERGETLLEENELTI